MSFRSAGFRPAILGYAVALAFTLSSSVVMAQEAKAPAAAATAAPACRSRRASGLKPPPPSSRVTPPPGQAKAAVCGACHGMDGNSSDRAVPEAGWPDAAYIVRQLTDFKAGKRQNPIMLGMATPLSDPGHA